MLEIVQFATSEETKNSGSLQEELVSMFYRIFPNGYMMLAVVISTLILLTVLTFLVYKPVKKSIKARKEFIQQNIDDSLRLKQEAQILEEEKNKNLIESRIAAAEIVFKSKIQAEKIVNEYTNLANKESSRILNEAQQSIKHQKEQFKRESKEEIIIVASKIASKFMQRKVDIKLERELFEELLESEIKLKEK